MWNLNETRRIAIHGETITIENRLNAGILQNVKEFPLFGIILYTEEHGMLRKYLNDKAFWEQLDSITGDRWIVFAIKDSEELVNAGPVEYEKIFQKTEKKVESLGPFKPMDNLRLLGWFGLEKIDLPCVLIFQVMQDLSLRSYAVKVSGTSMEKINVCVRKICKITSKALEKIAPENLGNKEEIFELVRSELKDFKIKNATVKVVQGVLSPAAKIFEFLKGSSN